MRLRLAVERLSNALQKPRALGLGVGGGTGEGPACLVLAPARAPVPSWTPPGRCGGGRFAARHCRDSIPLGLTWPYPFRMPSICPGPWQANGHAQLRQPLSHILAEWHPGGPGEGVRARGFRLSLTPTPHPS